MPVLFLRLGKELYNMTHWTSPKEKNAAYAIKHWFVE